MTAESLSGTTSKVWLPLYLKQSVDLMIEQADYWKDLSTVLLYIQEPGIMNFVQCIRKVLEVRHLFHIWSCFSLFSKID